MSKVLIQFAHPTHSKSNVQKTLEKYARKVKGVTFNDLYEHYPDLFIDIKREQQLLAKHDIIVFQHPFYWYSSPPILKQWQDLVLEYNWAYGPKGQALKGKKIFNAVSCGGGRDAYTSSGYNRFPVGQYLLPFNQTAYLCRMDYLPPFVVHETYTIEDYTLKAYGEQYAELLDALVNDRIDPAELAGVEYLNELFPH
ncbi:NAD(P)H-dependent oxidoreductase [Dyadobacter jiangsuensis]|uniref:Kef-type potassium/proton antiporter accessory protein (CPA2 family) n=1 Tax=Dyadobacter jiangsuensis TaxID=1591085 RepID=A0A2P8G5H3_9BACT|nr:NAD(P)H-dependent oxidoreductase [Dyadobacter jiangsuensis]PSL29231.1 Kef-type potassium/proton antiporter accessory protein (CPA2 family) [Dyadobacter jiangsuensis]